jgi:hypothetical protein
VVKKIGVTIATLTAAGAFAVTGPVSAAQSPARAAAGDKCPSICPQIYAPVVCKFSDGTKMRFANRCYAEIYACNNKLKILGCKSLPV